MKTRYHLIRRNSRGGKFYCKDTATGKRTSLGTANEDDANCYDNVMMESFWSTLKRELIHRCQFATRAEAKSAIFEWIKVFYNRVRLHNALGCQSPVDFETKLN